MAASLSFHFEICWGFMGSGVDWKPLASEDDHQYDINYQSFFKDLSTQIKKKNHVSGLFHNSNILITLRCKAVLDGCKAVLERCKAVQKRWKAVLNRCILGCHVLGWKRCKAVLDRCMAAVHRCKAVLDGCAAARDRCTKILRGKSNTMTTWLSIIYFS